MPAVALELLLLQPAFQVPVRALDRPVLIGDAAVVARGDHTQEAAQLALAVSEIACIAAIVVAKPGAVAVGAVFSLYVTAEAQGVLQRF